MGTPASGHDCAAGVEWPVGGARTAPSAGKQPRPRILFVTYALTAGGTNRVLLADALALKGLGIDVAVAGACGAWRRRLDTADVPFYRLYFLDPERYSPVVRYAIGLPLTFLALLWLVKRQSIDLICIHHQQSSLPAWLISKITRTSYVFFAHCVFERGLRFCFPGQHVIAVSPAVRDRYVQTLGLDSRQVYVLPNAVAAPTEEPDELTVAAFATRWALPAESPVVACVALMNANKGHRVFLEAWSRVLDHCPKAIAVLAGDGPLRRELEDYATALRVDSSVRFLGMVDDMALVYARASFIVLSSFSEGMPLAPLEAAAYGKATVATKVGGTPEVVVDQHTGLLVPPGDVKALASAMTQLLLDGQRCEQLGASARSTLVSRDSSHHRAQSLVRYFLSLIPG